MAAFAPPCGRGTRGRHFTVFQSQPPGRQPFGLKVKSPRAFGPAPLPEGGPWGNRLHPIQGPKRQPGTVHETSGGPGCRAPHECSGAGSANPTRGPVEARTPPRSAGGPGRHPPLEGCRLARGPGGLPGRSLSLSLGRESDARTSGATGVIPERGPAKRILWPLSFDQESGDTGVGLLPDKLSNLSITHGTS